MSLCVRVPVIGCVLKFVRLFEPDPELVLAVVRALAYTRLLLLSMLLVHVLLCCLCHCMSPKQHCGRLPDEAVQWKVRG